jgi:hypothetical protein
VQDLFLVLGQYSPRLAEVEQVEDWQLAVLSELLQQQACCLTVVRQGYHICDQADHVADSFLGRFLSVFRFDRQQFFQAKLN